MRRQEEQVRIVVSSFRIMRCTLGENQFGGQRMAVVRVLYYSN